jgi:hypothetical protein
MLRRSIFVVENSRCLLITRSIVINPKGVIPYAIAKWDQIRQKECVYVDRTKAIAKIDSKTFHSCFGAHAERGNHYWPTN